MINKLINNKCVENRSKSFYS